MQNNQILAISELPNCIDFWRLWQEYRDELYRCCLKWMNQNPTDAEDALSQAMLKAWEKVQQFAGKIANFKAWLTKLTYNLCLDIHRKRTQGDLIDNIEAIGEKKELLLDDTLHEQLETEEKKITIRRAIDKLSNRLRETFILYFYQELSYQEIAQKQEISYQNVCKRISQARAVLREELRVYFIGEDRTQRELSILPRAGELAKEEKSQNAGVSLYLPMEEVSKEAGLLGQHSESPTIACERKLYQVAPIPLLPRRRKQFHWTVYSSRETSPPKCPNQLQITAIKSNLVLELIRNSCRCAGVVLGKLSLNKPWRKLLKIRQTSSSKKQSVIYLTGGILLLTRLNTKFSQIFGDLVWRGENMLSSRSPPL